MATYTMQYVNLGTIANDGTGTPLRTGLDYFNDNFLELAGAMTWDSTTKRATFAEGADFTDDISATFGALSGAGVTTGDVLELNGDVLTTGTVFRVSSNNASASHTGALFELVNDFNSGATAPLAEWRQDDDGDGLILDMSRTGDAVVLKYNAIDKFIFNPYQGALEIYNGAVAPSASVVNGTILYSEDVSSSSELKVRDEAGNVTTLSPHNASLLPNGKFKEPMGFGYYSEFHETEEITIPELREIRQRQVVKTIIETKEKIEVVNGVATLIKTDVEKEVGVFDKMPVFDVSGKPVMVIDTPETKTKKATYKQKIHLEPRLEDYEHIEPEHTIKQDTGICKKINCDVLDIYRKVEALTGEQLIFEVTE